MGSGSSRVEPSWYRSQKLLRDVRVFHERVVLAERAMRAGADIRRQLDVYVSGLKEGLTRRGVFQLSSVEILDEPWSVSSTEGRSNERSVDKFEVLSIIEGGDDLVTVNPSKIDPTASRYSDEVILRVKPGDTGRGSLRSREVGGEVKRRGVFMRSELRFFKVISADEVRSEFMQQIESCFKEFKMMTDAYTLHRAGSAVRIDLLKSSKVYMEIHIIPAFEVDGGLYVPRTYRSHESCLSWVRLHSRQQKRYIDSACGSPDTCHTEVFRLVTFIARIHPELSKLGANPIQESFICELKETANGSASRWCKDDLVCRVMSVLKRVEEALKSGFMKSESENINLLQDIDGDIMTSSARFLSRITNNETDLYDEVLQPTPSNTLYQLYLKYKLVSPPNRRVIY